MQLIIDLTWRQLPLTEIERAEVRINIEHALGVLAFSRCHSVPSKTDRCDQVYALRWQQSSIRTMRTTLVISIMNAIVTVWL